MLTIRESAELPLRTTRRFMDRIDYELFCSHNYYATFRVELENALDYLRVYGCRYSGIRRIERPSLISSTANPTLEAVTEERIDIRRHSVEILPGDVPRLAAFNVRFNECVQDENCRDEYLPTGTGRLTWEGPLMKDFTLNTTDEQLHQWIKTIDLNSWLLPVKKWSILV